jgi:hypothetical protein
MLSHAEMVRKLDALIDSSSSYKGKMVLQSRRVDGFRSVSRGMGLEDARMNVYIVGWDSIEVCIFFSSCVRIERAPC